MRRWSRLSTFMKRVNLKVRFFVDCFAEHAPRYYLHTLCTHAKHVVYQSSAGARIDYRSTSRRKPRTARLVT